MYKSILVKDKYVKRYSFQRLSIILAIVLWIFTAVRVFSPGIVRAVSVNSRKDMVSIFCNNVYRDVSSELTAYGVITESYLSDDAKTMLLTDIAEDIGLNAYKIVKHANEEDDSYALIQDSVYGDVDIRILSSQNKYYLAIDIKLDKGIEGTEQYKKIVETVCEEYGIDCVVNVCLKGAVDGRIDITDRKNLCNELLKQLKAKEIQSRKTMDMFVVYAYDRSEKDYVMLGKKKININSKTLLLIAFPVLLILIFATSTLYLTITNRNLQKDVDTLQTQIEEALAATASNTNSDQQKELSKLNEQLTNLQTITQTLSKYPQIDKGILETIDKSCKNLTIDSISFNQETGAISLTVTASKVNGCEETVRTLRESGTFKTVDYNGYTQDGGVSETTETVTDPTTGATTTQTVTNTTPITYKSSITCTLEGGTTSGQD